MSRALAYVPGSLSVARSLSRISRTIPFRTLVNLSRLKKRGDLNSQEADLLLSNLGDTKSITFRKCNRYGSPWDETSTNTPMFDKQIVIPRDARRVLEYSAQEDSPIIHQVYGTLFGDHHYLDFSGHRNRESSNINMPGFSIGTFSWLNARF